MATNQAVTRTRELRDEQYEFKKQKALADAIAKAIKDGCAEIAKAIRDRK